MSLSRNSQILNQIREMTVEMRYLEEELEALEKAEIVKNDYDGIYPVTDSRGIGEISRVHQTATLAKVVLTNMLWMLGRTLQMAEERLFPKQNSQWFFLNLAANTHFHGDGKTLTDISQHSSSQSDVFHTCEALSWLTGTTRLICGALQHSFNVSTKHQCPALVGAKGNI